MTERREGSTRIIEYRDGYEIRVTLAGVWWRKIGGRLTEAKSIEKAMRSIDREAGPHPPKPAPAAAPVSQDVKYVSARPWVEWSKEGIPHREIERERD